MHHYIVRKLIGGTAVFVVLLHPVWEVFGERGGDIVFNVDSYVLLDVGSEPIAPRISNNGEIAYLAGGKILSSTRGDMTVVGTRPALGIDINDHGEIVYTAHVDGFRGQRVVSTDRGVLLPNFEARYPSINNGGVIAFVHTGASKQAGIYLSEDGIDSELLVPDFTGRVQINDAGEILYVVDDQEVRIRRSNGVNELVAEASTAAVNNVGDIVISVGDLRVGIADPADILANKGNIFDTDGNLLAPFAAAVADVNDRGDILVYHATSANRFHRDRRVVLLTVTPGAYTFPVFTPATPCIDRDSDGFPGEGNESSTCPASTFKVRSNTDAPDSAPGDGICRSPGSPGGYSCTLRAAVMEANALPGADTIVIEKGTYKLRESGEPENFAVSGDLDILEAVLIRGEEESATIVDANGLNSAFELISDETPVKFESLTITNAEDVAIADIDANYVSLKNCTISNSGGGVDSNFGLTMIHDSTFVDNGSAVFSYGDIEVAGSHFEGNRGCAVVGDEDVRVSDSLFVGNGCGVRGRDVSVRNCELLSNGTAVVGTGCSNDELGEAAIFDSRLIDNDTGFSLCEALGSVSRSTISGSEVAIGGVEVELVLSRSTIGPANPFDPQAEAHRIVGSLSGHYNSTDVIVVASTIVGNMEITGPATTCIFTNSIVATSDRPICRANGASTEESIEYLGENIVCRSPNKCVAVRSERSAELEEIIEPISDNHGGTPTYALPIGSIAIDAVAVGAPCGSFDQRGAPRPQGTSCDVGAFEYGCGNEITDPGEECDDGNITNGDGCSYWCQSQRLCGDADDDGAILAGDAFRILKRAVGLNLVCPDWICDVDGDLVVTASDSLQALRAAVLLDTNFQCPDVSRVVFRVSESEKLGALQFSVDYAAVSGEFFGSGEEVRCFHESFSTDSVFNDRESRTLEAGFVSLEGLSGPVNVGYCDFFPRGEVDVTDFQVTVRSAVNLVGDPVSVVVTAIPH